MTEQEKAKLEATKTICYWSCYGGVEVKHIEYGVDNYVTYISGTMCGKRTYHRSKMHQNCSGDYYIRLRGRRLYFDQCIRNS